MQSAAIGSTNGHADPESNVGLLQATPAPQAQELAQAGSAVISHLVALRGNEMAGELGRLGATGSLRVRAGPGLRALTNATVPARCTPQLQLGVPT